MENKKVFCICDWGYSVTQKAMDDINFFLNQHENTQIIVFNEMEKVGAADNENTRDKIFDLAKSDLFAGYILLTNPTGSKQEQNAFIREIRSIRDNLPIVTIGERFEHCMYVGNDIRASEFRMIDPLLKWIQDEERIRCREQFAGYTDKDQQVRAAFVGGVPGTKISRDKEAGFLEACRINGLRENAVHFVGSAWTVEGGVKIAEQLLKSGEPLPNIISCARSAAARGLVKCLKEHSAVRIPEDIIVCGFDDNEKTYSPDQSIISIERNDGKVIQQALDMLDRFLHREKVKPEAYIPYIVRFERQLSNGTPLRKASREELRSELVNNRQRILQREMKEQLYFSQRDEMEFMLMKARTLGEILTTFEHYADTYQWGDLYIVMNSEYRYGLENIEDAEHFPDKMALAAVVGADHNQCRPDPVTHMYEVFDTDQILPDDLRADKRLLNIFLLHNSGILLGYVIVAGTPDRLGYYHIGSLCRMLVSLIENCRHTAMMKSLNEQLQDLYIHDSLTGMFNRFGLEKRGREFFDRLKKERDITFWFVDVDNMKGVNDCFGHKAGDDTLRKTAQTLKRIANIYGLFAMRYGGDEFLIFGHADPEEVVSEIQKHLEKISVENSLIQSGGGSSEKLSIDASIGYYTVQKEDDKTLDACIIEADREMYEIKSKRKVRRGKTTDDTQEEKPDADPV